MDLNHPPSDLIETAGEAQDGPDSQQGSPDVPRPLLGARRSQLARQSAAAAAAAAEFERLKARLRHLVGTNNTAR